MARGGPDGLGDRVPRAVVLVEGESDRVAVEAVARRAGRDLPAEGLAVLPMGGVTNLRRYLARYGPGGLDVPVAGLYDAAQEPVVRRALVSLAPLGADPAAAGRPLERWGFFACVPDLEAELIRAVGLARVEQVIAAQGELGALTTLRRQRWWHEKPAVDQVRRFLGNGGRKAGYARLLVEALDGAPAPPPLAALLAHLARPQGLNATAP